jgi:uncharacterized protein YfaS (alpha-2-macroglobulin family)
MVILSIFVQLPKTTLTMNNFTRKTTAIISLFLLLLLSGCSHKIKVSEIRVNPYVNAFTSNCISRYAPISIVFSQDIPEDKRSSDELKKNIDISPSVDGDFVMENNHTVIFKPKTSFKRNTDYSVTVDISAWFDAKGDDKEFKFGFSTMPFVIRSYFKSLDISKENKNAYDVTCTLITPDKEKPEDVESAARISEDADVQWQHNSDGRRHTLVMRGIKSDDEEQEVTVKVKKTDKPTDDLSIKIPAKGDFSVYNVDFESDPERYIEVTFTKNLDPSQSLEGLVSIEGNTNETMTVKDNKVRLYPDNNKKGSVKVNISKEIRSTEAHKLGKDIVRDVNVGGNRPMVNFVGNGVVVPTSDETLVPFQASHVRGVMVSVTKIMEKNIGQFLQINNLDGSEELARVGRMVTRKVIFLDEDPSNDLNKVNTYALDLKELIKLEPGAIYRVELSINKQLSITQRDSGDVKLSKEQIIADNEAKFKEDCKSFDNGEYYYYNNNADYDDEIVATDENGNPAADNYNYDRSVSKNVMASNLGVMVKGGGDGTMNVFVHNLLTTEPESGVNVKFYNYQGQIIGNGKTNSDGRATVVIRAGSPFYLIASLKEQRAYVRMDNGSALSLSAFKVDGEVVQKGIKGFIYGDRGVWRPGDTMHISFMLNDRSGILPEGHPVVMELYNPMGQLYFKKTETNSILGLYAFDLPTESNVPTGTWNIKVSVGGATFTKSVRIETIKPNRLKININTKSNVLLKNSPMDGNMHVEWMQGAIARNLKYDIQGAFRPVTTTFKGFDGYCFDDPSKTFSNDGTNLITGKTDASGNAKLTPTFDTGSSAPGMLLADFVTKVYEETGDFSIDTKTMLYSPYGSYAGIKSPQQKDDSPLSTNKKYFYQVASVSYDGHPLSNRNLEVKVFKVDWYWWYNSDNSNLASFVSNSYNQPVKDMSFVTDGQGKANFELSFTNDEWGTYFIQVIDKVSKHSTGVMNYYDMPYYEGRRNTQGADAATMLTFKTDKDTYAPGDKIVVTFPSSEGSRAIITVENGARVLSVTETKCNAKQTTVKLDATEEMEPNAYIYITLLQPHAQTKNDLPIRLYGVVPITVTSPGSHLMPVINMPNEIKPENNYTVSVSEQNGQKMAYTLAIVDEGLLDLTHFKTPDPWNAFNAHEALGVTTWDMYNYVVGAFGGRIEQLFSIGGDNALNKAPKAIVNRFKPVVHFEGPFLLNKGERKQHTIAMPNYYGRVRVMVIAGNGKAYGCAEKSVMVRKPVMILGTLPRIIGINEEMAVPATVFATVNNIGTAKVAISCSNNLHIIGTPTQSLFFREKGDRTISFRVRVKSRTGVAHVKLVAIGKGEKSTYETDIEIRSVRHTQTKVQGLVIGKGALWKHTITLPGVDGTNRLSLEVSTVQPLNLGNRLSYLFNYPYGCIEQITSKAFPQIYLKQFVTLTPAQQKTSEATVKDCISKQRSYQTADGGFSYWPGETSTNAWGTVYAAHFLHEAEAGGYYVPNDMKRSVIANMSLIARSWKPVKSYYSRSEELTQAYRLYVLALMGSPEMGAMNRMKETSGFRL